MKAMPHPGLRSVGGATPNRGAALADEGAANTRCPRIELPAPRPAEAMLAALSWHANQAITQQVDAAYGLAAMARAHGLAVAESVDSSLPEGPVRDAMTVATNAYIQCAENAAQAATRYGRHFGHLAFAFPRPGS